jgi:hypothetical protein
MSLNGVDELSNALIALPQALRRQVLMRAVNKAGRVMVPALRRATPKSKRKYGKQAKANPSGTLRKSTGIVVRKYRGGAIAAGYIGHKWPKGAAAHLVSRGTTDRQTRKGVRTGRVKGSEFFERVYSAHKSQVTSTLQSELAKGIAAATKKNDMKVFNKAIL